MADIPPGFHSRPYPPAVVSVLVSGVGHFISPRSFPILIPLHSLFPPPEPITLNIVCLAVLLPVAALHADAHGLSVDDLYADGYLLFLFHGLTLFGVPNPNCTGAGLSDRRSRFYGRRLILKEEKAGERVKPGTGKAAPYWEPPVIYPNHKPFNGWFSRC